MYKLLLQSLPSELPSRESYDGSLALKNRGNNFPCK